MTKDVLLTISGLHLDAFSEVPDEDIEPIEVITPATYYLKNGKHYVLYDEVVEGMLGSIKNTIKITGDSKLEMKKSGIAITNIVFEKEKMNVTQYDTPYGEMMVGVYTKDMKVDVTENDIDVSIAYALDVNSEKVADCNIVMNIKANGH